MVKVLHIIASADPAHGGPIEGLLRAGEIWRTRGHHQDVMTLDPPDSPSLPTDEHRIIPVGLPLARWRSGRGHFPMRRYSYAPDAVPWLRANARKYDIVMVNGLWNYSTVAALRGLKGLSLPLVVMPHGMLDPWFARTYPLKTLMKKLSWHFVEGPLINKADAVFFTTEEEMRLARETFRPYHPTERIVSYGAAMSKGNAATQVAHFRASVPALGQRPFLLFLSRIHEKKGCDLLLAAFAAVHKDHPELDLVMAGPDKGLRKTLQEQAATLGISARVHWTGMLAGDAKWGALHACEAFVLPSHQENFGIAVAEAMGSHKPVLISDKVNIWREVVAGQAGLVEPDTLAGTISLLTAFLALDPVSRARMGEAAGETFARQFDVERTALKYIDLMAEIVETSGNAATRKAAGHA